MFCVDMGLSFFFDNFVVFFMFTIFGIPDIERRKRGIFSEASLEDLCPKVGDLLCLFVLI